VRRVDVGPSLPLLLLTSRLRSFADVRRVDVEPSLPLLLRTP
jgi:hypothetical protein